MWSEHGGWDRGHREDMEENLRIPNPVRNLHPHRPIPQKHREKGTTFVFSLELIGQSKEWPMVFFFIRAGVKFTQVISLTAKRSSFYT